MKTALLTILTLVSMVVFGQTDKSKRPSPPDSVKVTTTDGVTIEIHYSSPSLKGRQIGVDIAPVGQVWRTGANEATTIEINKNVLVNGKKLPAGKYSIYSIPEEIETTIIFNKVWNQWGTKYDQAQDALRVVSPNDQSTSSQERFKISAATDGTVSFAWGNYIVNFGIKADQ